MFRGVVKSWLSATIPRLASSASVKDGCECCDEAVLLGLELAELHQHYVQSRRLTNEITSWTHPVAVVVRHCHTRSRTVQMWEHMCQLTLAQLSNLAHKSRSLAD